MPLAPARLQSLNKITFDDHLSSEPRLESSWGGVFCHPVFLAPARGILNLEGQPSFITQDQNRIGAINLLWGEHFPFRTVTLPLLFQYFGPIFFDQISCPSVLTQLDRHLAGLGDFAYLSFPPDIRSLDGLPSEWKVIKNLTLVFTGKDMESWGREFRDDVKNKLNKAAREKVEIYETDNPPYDLWETAYARRGIAPPIQPASLKSWCQALIESSLLRVFEARVDNKPVAFRGELVHGAFAYDWIAGSDPAYHSVGANQLLMAEIGQEFRRLNLAAWDLVGGEIPGIADFKRSFGAKDTSYFQASRSYGIKGKAFEILRIIRHGRH